jgi:endopeptidase La
LLASRGESTKLKTWIDAVMTIPFGIYKGINIKSFNPNQIKTFLTNLQKTMDNAVWGHDDAKRHIIQIMGQKFRNPSAKGSMIGIYGPPGNGKSSLVKEGIAKAMDKPFVFISLGGATDSSFLEGHSYTYEGSIYGRIANGLINSKCMDPIIYFDELDKISQTAKGDEITNLLIHLTDPVQNDHFRDKYFHGIDFDLSRATMIFSFNNPSLVDKVLLDRITSIETKYLLTTQKIHIGKNYLLPEILKDVGLNKTDLTIDDDLLKFIIEKYTNEGGVRKLKSLLYSIVRELNISNLTKNKIDNKIINFPYKLSEQNIKTLFKNKYEFEYDKIHKEHKVGIVNGLYATTSGIGGVLPIETLWIPTINPLDIKATGHLEQVIKESTQVACSLAWNLLDTELQTDYLKQWKEKSMGFHLHCPDGSTPKDGPSAGAALTLALYSMFTNKKIRYDVALTGEINLQGNVTAIGGLEEKMEGAKKAGVKLVLYPKENEKDVEKIKERNKDLFDENFTIKSVETIHDVIKNAIFE